MLDANPSLTVAQVREILRTTALEWGPTGQDVDYGWGRLDTHAAVKRAGSYSSGSGPAVPSHQFFSGHISTAGQQAEHSFSISDTSYPVAVTVILPGWTGSSSPDFEKSGLERYHSDSGGKSGVSV